MENWCYDPATLKNFAKHWQTGAAMPEELLTKLRTSRRFHAGLATVRQLEFALFDLRLHRDFDPTTKSKDAARVLELLEPVRDDVAVSRPPAFRSEEHKSDLQSIMRISSAVLCFKNKQK